MAAVVARDSVIPYDANVDPNSWSPGYQIQRPGGNWQTCQAPAFLSVGQWYVGADE
jgi:hypothetical protein